MHTYMYIGSTQIYFVINIKLRQGKENSQVLLTSLKCIIIDNYEQLKLFSILPHCEYTV